MKYVEISCCGNPIEINLETKSTTENHANEADVGNTIEINLDTKSVAENNLSKPDDILDTLPIYILENNAET